MKRHNGGAGVIRCGRYDDVSEHENNYYLERRYTSGLFLRKRNATDEELALWDLQPDE